MRSSRVATRARARIESSWCIPIFGIDRCNSRVPESSIKCNSTVVAVPQEINFWFLEWLRLKGSSGNTTFLIHKNWYLNVCKITSSK